MKSLGISGDEYGALLRVASRLRSGEFFHFKTPDMTLYQQMYSVVTRGKEPRIFDMSIIMDAPCGKVGCIARWVSEELGHTDPREFLLMALKGYSDNRDLFELVRQRSQCYTPAMAADAIDTYLLTGTPQWRQL